MSSPLQIDYYSDVLCIWAWIVQRRLEELEEQWGEKIQLRYHYLNLFGDTQTRIAQSWKDRGGFDGFGQHVLESAAPYDTAPVSPSIWKAVQPKTSAIAHLVLKAAELAYGILTAANLAIALRQSFFVETRDIGQLAIVLDVASEAGLDRQQLKELIDNGEAMAALMTDLRLAQDQAVMGSPTWIMNQGRQVLYGNVGYRVLHANIEEILKRPLQEASWC